MSTTDHKTIELRTGRAHGRRLVVPINTTEVSVPIDGAKGFDATEIYRPTATRSADGVEVWTPYVPPAWPETNVDPLA